MIKVWRLFDRGFIPCTFRHRPACERVSSPTPKPVGPPKKREWRGGESFPASRCEVEMVPSGILAVRGRTLLGCEGNGAAGFLGNTRVVGRAQERR